MAKNGNYDIKIAAKQLQMASEDVSIAKSGHLPSLNVMGNYQYQGNGGVDGGNTAAQEQATTAGSLISSYTQASIGLQANVPIYSGGGVSSQVRQATSAYQSSQQQLVSTERQTDQNTQNAFWQVQNGVSIVKAQTQALKSAQIKLASDQTGYQVGIRNSVDLVNSEKNYYQAIQNYNQSRYQYLNYRLQLKFLAGQIDQAFLKKINFNIDQKQIGPSNGNAGGAIANSGADSKLIINTLKQSQVK